MAAVLVGSAGAALVNQSAVTSVVLPVGAQVGDLLVVKNNSATTTNLELGGGVLSVSAGALGTQYRTTASRANTHNTQMIAAFVTSTIPAGSTVSITALHTNNRRTMIAEVWRGLKIQAPEYTSGDPATGLAANNSAGYNAQSTSFSFNVGPQTTAKALALGTYALSGTVVATAGSGWTFVGEQRTTETSAYRGVLSQYKVLEAVSTVACTMTVSATITSAGVGMIFAIADDDPGPVEDTAVWVDSSGDKHAVTKKAWVTSDGVAHEVTTTVWVDASGDAHAEP